MRRGFRLINVTRHTVLATDLCVAETFWERVRGLLGRKNLAPGEGLVIPRCRSVHMWGMRFPIDVVFLDRSSRIVWQRQGLAPGAISPIIWRAVTCIELQVGTLVESQTQVGDQLELTEA